MTLQPEDVVHKEIRNRLIEIGWRDGNSELKISEHTLIEHYYLPDVLEKKVVEINQEKFFKLREEERRKVIEKIFDDLNSEEKRILDYLKYGIKVKVDREIWTFHLIDHQKPERNYFFFLHEAKFRGSPDNSEPDFTLFINGIPIVIIEAKPESIPFSHTQALKDIRSYEMKSPDLFRFVQFAIAYGDEKRYTPTLPNWEKKKREENSFNWKDDIFDLLKPSRLVEFIKYFTFFWIPEEGLKKKLIARWNQYRATKRAMKRIEEHLNNGKSKGLIWHWQGSGKTFTMFFIANYFFDRYYSQNPVVFFVVDRQDLERQHDEVLKSVQEEKFRNYYKKIESISELCKVIETLKESEFSKNVISRGIYLTTIQKFQRGRQTNFEGLSEKEDQESTQRIYSLLHKLAKRYLEYLEKSDQEEYRKVVEKLSSLKGKDKEKYILDLGGVKNKFVLFLIDEAHRSHYSTLGAMRKASFPNCITFGFTGTPIFKHERNTFLEFSYPAEGEYYLDVYFIGDSIRDGFTLPLVYDVVKEGDIEAEGIQIKLTENEIADFIKEYMKKHGEIDKLLEAKITKKDIRDNITKAKVILLNPERIDKLAKYIVDRIEEDTRNFKFKAMVVAVNRLGCVRYKRALDKYLVKKFGEKARKWAEIVMTYSYKETEGEILEYMEELRKRWRNKDYDEINKEIQDEFKNKDNPRILIVTDMLLTGFDAPKLRVMYLDKPLYEHRLLQAIARVNRPYKDKEYGLIVDSVGLMEHLTKTMAIYNLLADEDAIIRQDLKLNLMSSIKQKFSEFEYKFNRLKEELKTLKVGKEEIEIDLDAAKNALKTGEGKEELIAKIKTLAMLYTEDVDLSVKLIKLVNDMKSILKLYKALGAYREKIVYVEDIQTLAYIYYKLKVIISPKTKKLGKDFWDELRSYIHKKTIVEEFKEIGKVKLEPEKIEKLASELAERFGEEELRKKMINQLADYFFYIRNFVREKMHDPVYRQIAEKIERLRIEWITRTINTKTFLARIRAIESELEEYRERIENKSLEERLKESMRYYVRQKTTKSVDFTNTEKYLRKLASRSAKMLPAHEDELAAKILEDLFLADIKENEATKLADELVEYVKKELEKVWSERK